MLLLYCSNTKIFPAGRSLSNSMLHDTELMHRELILLPQNFSTVVKLLNKQKFVPISGILSEFFSSSFHEHFTGFVTHSRQVKMFHSCIARVWLSCI